MRVNQCQWENYVLRSKTCQPWILWKKEREITEITCKNGHWDAIRSKTLETLRSFCLKASCLGVIHKLGPREWGMMTERRMTGHRSCSQLTEERLGFILVVERPPSSAWEARSSCMTPTKLTAQLMKTSVGNLSWKMNTRSRDQLGYLHPSALFPSQWTLPGVENSYIQIRRMYLNVSFRWIDGS